MVVDAPGEVILPLPASFNIATRIRSTLLVSSLASVRAHGHEAAYFAALAPHLHSEMLEAVVGSWMPIDIAKAHYAACDTLDLSVDAQVAIGVGVGERVRGTLLGTTVRLAKGVGVTPWTVLPHLQRFWNRAFDGGGVSVVRMGPKEATIEGHKVALYDSRYFRASQRGVIISMLEMFCSKVYCTERPGARAPSSVRYRVQWA